MDLNPSDLYRCSNLVVYKLKDSEYTKRSNIIFCHVWWNEHRRVMRVDDMKCEIYINLIYYGFIKR
jgi:hypothetical protein